jgi:hypothetical protein
MMCSARCRSGSTAPWFFSTRAAARIAPQVASGPIHVEDADHLGCGEIGPSQRVLGRVGDQFVGADRVMTSSIPAPRRPRSPSMWRSGCLSGVTRTCHPAPSRAVAISTGFRSSLPGQNDSPWC